MKSDFPSSSVISSYISTEDLLIDVLRVIPYCNEHEMVWSPNLVTILLETCSQLDSLWRCEARQSTCAKDDPDIADYFCYFGERMARNCLVFYGEDARIVQPFEAWIGAPSYQRKDYQRLDWWAAYNKVKHDRYEYRREARLKYSLHALGGLFIAILRSEVCRDAVAQTEKKVWINDDQYFGGVPEAV